MLHFHGSPSPTKSFPGLVSASASGLTIHAQTVRFGGDVYQVPETSIPIAFSGEPTRCRVVLTAAGLVLDEQELSEAPRSVPGEVCYLADLTLRSASDTCETVDVHVIRRECTSAQPADARIVAVPAGVVVPSDTPERTASRRRLRRIRYLRQQLRALKEAGTAPSAFTAAQWRIVNELVALQSDGVPMLVEDVPA